MDPLDRAARSLQVMRERLAAGLKPADGTSTAGTATAGAAASAARPGGDPVRGAVARRLKALDADDPRYPELATDVFVESVLLAEFGDTLSNDPAFRRLIKDVGREMRSDAVLQAGLLQLARELRAAG